MGVKVGVKALGPLGRDQMLKHLYYTCVPKCASLLHMCDKIVLAFWELRVGVKGGS